MAVEFGEVPADDRHERSERCISLGRGEMRVTVASCEGVVLAGPDVTGLAPHPRVAVRVEGDDVGLVAISDGDLNGHVGVRWKYRAPIGEPSSGRARGAH